MLALATKEYSDNTAKTAASAFEAFFKDEPTATDAEKAQFIATLLNETVKTDPHLLRDDAKIIVASLPAQTTLENKPSGITKAVATLALTRLGKPAPKPKTEAWYGPLWVKIAIGVAIVAAISGTVYFVWRRKTQ